MKIKSILQIVLGLFFGVFFAISVHAENQKSSLLVAFFHKAKKSDFEQIKAVFDQNKTCKSCDLVDRTPYNESGLADEDKFIHEISSLTSEYQIIFINWNERIKDTNQKLSDELVKKSLAGSLVFFTAGAPTNNEPTISLSKTVAGQIPEAIIVGEMTARERLLPNLFYGPEMLSAIKPPNDIAGQGLAPVYFLSKWVSHWSKRKPNEWISYLKLKKNKTKKIWLGIDDFFPR